MNKKLLIAILGILEKEYPKILEIRQLIKKLKLSSYKEFFQIIEYLQRTDNIQINVLENEILEGVGYPKSKRKEISLFDKIGITSKGIDTLTTLKDLIINEERNNATTKATIVLALVGFIQAISYFNQFSKGVKNILDWLFLLTMGIMTIIIFNISWSSFNYLVKKSY